MSTLSFTEVATRRRFAPQILPALGLGLIASACFALTIGRFPLGYGDIARFFGAALGLAALPADRFDLLHNVIIEIRAPRIIAAAAVGAGLSVAGAAFQSVFRNPLASPGLLGASGGACFGAAFGLLIGASWTVIQGLSFGGGLLAVALGVAIANLFGAASMITLVLGGMISGAFFTALLSLLKYVADPYDQLPNIVYWLMGSLSGVTLSQALIAAPVLFVGILGLCALGKPLDALAMGEDEARSLGVPVASLRYGAIALATLITALCVSLSGMIGWIGLFAPHFARLLVGPRNSVLAPASALIGAIFLVLADCFARSVARAEIPIGIVTELAGIPAFLLVLARARKGWT